MASTGAHAGEVRGLTIREKLGLVYTLCVMTIYKALAGGMALFRDRKTTRSWEHEVRNRTARYLMASTSTRQLQALFPNTESTVAAACRELNLLVQVEHVGKMGAKLHWIGHGDTNQVLFYIHGGGFGLSPNPGHVKFAVKCRDKMQARGARISVAFLEYGLTPTTKYPSQYMQALDALSSILKRGYNSSDIVAAGDSAGGNICLAVMSLLRHPTPLAPHVTLEAPIRGLVLICPWVSFDSNSASYLENAARDVIFPGQVHDWANAFACPSERNEYSEPIRASAGWWKGIPTEQTLIVCGNDEVFKDDIQRLGMTMAEAGLNVQVSTCSKQIHIDCILDEQHGLDPGPMSHAIWDWLVSL
ncbi:alpha/beta hydrolase fold-domain-containing protein [Aspergillus pseudodeflectus]|uniref:Alpha/beta hydrolase fold-domain-containing protein n=1 Tax=Aspergillus pseudodeflectus TaxID=176178 RepID=A0ABR4K424_9EURO